MKTERIRLFRMPFPKVIPLNMYGDYDELLMIVKRDSLMNESREWYLKGIAGKKDLSEQEAKDALFEAFFCNATYEDIPS